VLCTVNGPMEPTSAKARQQYDRATINVEFTVGAFSTLERKKRSRTERLAPEDRAVTDIDGYKRLILR